MAKFTMSNIAYGVGLALGYRGVVGIDVDTDDTAKIRAVISVMPPIRAAKRGRRGFTAFFQDPMGKVRRPGLGSWKSWRAAPSPFCRHPCTSTRVSRTYDSIQKH